MMQSVVPTTTIPKDIKGLVWDLDGTLLDSFGLYCDILAEALPAHTVSMPSEAVLLRHFHGKLEHSIGSACEVEGKTLDAIVADFLRLQHPHYANLDGHIFDDALDLLQRAHIAGLKQIIITNRSHEGRGNASPRRLITHPPLNDLIELVVCGDDNAFHKPDARVLDDAEHALGLSRQELLVVGDQFVDAQLAHNLGTAAILVTRKSEPIPHLERLDELAPTVTIVTSLKQVVLPR